MTERDWLKWQTIFTGAASLVALGAVIISVLLTYRQIDKGAEIQREATGRAYWLEFIKYTAENSELSCPADSGQAYVAITAKKDPTPEELKQLAKYNGYLTLMLSTFETVLDFVADANDQGWRDTFRGRMACHEAVITSAAFVDIAYCTYSEELRKLMREAFHEIRSEWQDCSHRRSSMLKNKRSDF